MIITELGSEVDALGDDVLLIAVWAVKPENVFDGSEVTKFVMISGCVSDVMNIEPVFTGGCDSRASISAGSSESGFPPLP